MREVDGSGRLLCFDNEDLMEREGITGYVLSQSLYAFLCSFLGNKEHILAICLLFSHSSATYGKRNEWSIELLNVHLSGFVALLCCFYFSGKAFEATLVFLKGWK